MIHLEENRVEIKEGKIGHYCSLKNHPIFTIKEEFGENQTRSSYKGRKSMFVDRQVKDMNSSKNSGKSSRIFDNNNSNNCHETGEEKTEAHQDKVPEFVIEMIDLNGETIHGGKNIKSEVTSGNCDKDSIEIEEPVIPVPFGGNCVSDVYKSSVASDNATEILFNGDISNPRHFQIIQDNSVEFNDVIEIVPFPSQTHTNHNNDIDPSFAEKNYTPDLNPSMIPENAITFNNATEITAQENLDLDLAPQYINHCPPQNYYQSFSVFPNPNMYLNQPMTNTELVNFAAVESIDEYCADLPFSDPHTLQFFYNLGLEYFHGTNTNNSRYQNLMVSSEENMKYNPNFPNRNLRNTSETKTNFNNSKGYRTNQPKENYDWREEKGKIFYNNNRRKGNSKKSNKQNWNPMCNNFEKTWYPSKKNFYHSYSVPQNQWRMDNQNPPLAIFPVEMLNFYQPIFPIYPQPVY